MMTTECPAQDLSRDPHFSSLKEWVIRRTGLSYYSERDTDFISALARVFSPDSPLPLPSALTLLGRLQTSTAELDSLVEQLTIGETFFFRHVEMFNALRDSVFPDLLRRRAGSRSLRIWSAGCSIGAEPYSIAILLRELLGSQFRDWSIHILGTDINRRFLRMAEAGSYDPWTLRGMPPHVLHRCFTKEGNRWRLTDSCREGVTFRPHNLASDTFPDIARGMAGFDLIICRNVMIYFDQDSIQKLAGQFYETLHPGGWLAVGHAEPHAKTFRMFRTVNAASAVLYQRPAGEEASHPEAAPASEAPSTSRSLPSWQPPAFTHHSRPPAQWMPLPELSRTTASAEPAIPTQTATAIGSGTEDVAIDEITRHADLGDLKKALQACDDALLRHPLSSGIHYYHGMILCQFGEWAAAERSIRRSLYLARDQVLAHYYLGLVQERLGRSARRHFDNALDLLSGQPPDRPVPLGQGLTVQEFRSLLGGARSRDESPAHPPS